MGANANATSQGLPPQSLRKSEATGATAISWATPDKCEADVGTVMFDHVNLRKNASETYSLQFGDGHKEERSFAVVRRQQQNPFHSEMTPLVSQLFG